MGAYLLCKQLCVFCDLLSQDLAMLLNLLCKALSRLLRVQGCSFGLSLSLFEVTKEEIHTPVLQQAPHQKGVYSIFRESRPSFMREFLPTFSEDFPPKLHNSTSNRARGNRRPRIPTEIPLTYADTREKGICR